MLFEIVDERAQVLFPRGQLSDNLLHIRVRMEGFDQVPFPLLQLHLTDREPCLLIYFVFPQVVLHPHVFVAGKVDLEVEPEVGPEVKV